jgi:hypothetical protein
MAGKRVGIDFILLILLFNIDIISLRSPCSCMNFTGDRSVEKPDYDFPDEPARQITVVPDGVWGSFFENAGTGGAKRLKYR